jgi:hypothetical protein
MVMFKFNLPVVALSGLLVLASCDGAKLPSFGADPVPTPSPSPTPTPTPTPGLPSQYLPSAGFWNGKRTPGAWCQDKPSTQGLNSGFTAQSLRDAARSVPTDRMLGLRGAADNLTGLSAQNAQTQEIALLLPTGQDAARGLQTLEASGVQTLGEFGYWVTTQITAAQARDLVTRGLAQYAEGLPTLEPVGLPTPNDANLNNQSTYLPMMNTEAAWAQLDTGCDHPIVAVLDSGWTGSTTHAEYNLVPKSAWFNAMTATQGNADTIITDPSLTNAREHGTAVAGVIAMTTNGYGAGAGVSYNLAKVLPINVMSANGVINGTEAARGMEYALGRTTIGGQVFVNPYPANILSLSFGSKGTLSPNQFFQSIFDQAAAQGVVVVAAVGNDLIHGTTDTSGINHSIGVAGVMFDGNRWVDPYNASKGSNYGPGVDVAAPAMSVPTAINGDASYWTGTSLATPWAAAQIAMWMYANQQYRADGSKTQGLTGDALYDKLSACFAATGSNRGSKDEYLGYGKIDTARLISPTEAACR